MRLTLAFCLLLLAAAVATVTPAGAQDASSAKAFLAEAYRHYDKNGKGIDFAGPEAKGYYHSSLIALIRADNKANGPDNVGALDYDPLCSCQDWNGIFDLKIDIRLENPQRALATVSFALDDAKRRDSQSWRKLRIQLRTECGGWRIYDILDITAPQAPLGVREALIKDIRDIKQPAKSRTEQP